MSFYADNNRIRVLDGNETSFDTESNMPHIVGEAYVTNIAVDYSNASTSNEYWFTDFCAYYQYQFPYCTFEYVCSYNPPTYGFSYECYPCYYTGCYPFCYFNFTITPNPPYCTFNYVCTPNPPTCVAVANYQKVYVSREISTDTNIADLPVDEDGNPMSIDFVVIQASGSRTRAGTDQRLDQSFLNTVPPNTFSFQGSVLLESAARDNGSFWFRRIMSVFVNNNTKKLVLRKQETLAYRQTLKGNFTAAERSTFNFNFKVFFGRFKS